MAFTKEQALAALRTVEDPELFRDIVSLNMVKDVRVEGSTVHVHVELTTPACPMREALERDVRNALLKAGAETVEIEISANTRGAIKPSTDLLPQIKNILAVGAGKGGVGKSTLAVNLAVGLARTGAAVGLMDGDIYGPSLPTMLGLKGQEQEIRDNKLIPFQVHGIHAMSIGMMPGVGEEKPLIWRGPMAHSAFKQILADSTTWPALDYLVVDLPPGTGDVPLTLCQLLPLTGAVIVATPQQVALDDAVRALRMFQTLGAPILGIVENMSYFVGPHGEEFDVFGRGGAARAAQRLEVPFLGALPMFPELRVNSDAGTPEKNFQDNPALRDALEHIIKNIAGQISIRNLQPAAPDLTIT